jgi:transcriptional antiterminator RfaH
MLHWYLVHTKPSGEALAQANLQRQGYEVYFPRLLRSVRSSGRAFERIVALFPRYLFVRVFEGRQSIAPVSSSKGVTGLVRFGNRCAVIPDSVVRDLRERADPATGLFRLHDSRLAAGDSVRITAGPLDGLEGVFERKEGSDRVVVLLNLLGRQTSVRIPAAFVSPACAL